MALHQDFPRSPYDILPPETRWFPAAEELRATAKEKLLPPLVAKIREAVKDWRDKDYAGASPTSRALLNWWFKTDHLTEDATGTQSPFRYYFAQREAVETILWLYDVRGVRDKHDLLRFDASGSVSGNMFSEDWPRFVVKMATGAGKTKVLSLLIAWSFFHRLYEPGSDLSRNFLLIAPNIIVLDRLRADFDGLKIFFNDPVLPDNGHAGQNWRDDFQIALHIQDNVRIVRPTGNLFLTNIHRVYLGDTPEPSLEDENLRDYFLAPFGAKPTGKTTDSNVDLGEIVRAGLAALPPGQTDAARALGLSNWATLRKVLLPQALFAMIPSFLNQFIVVLKNTSVAYVIGVHELTSQAYEINSQLLSRPFEVYAILAVVYYGLNRMLGAGVGGIERRVGRKAVVPA